ncbi:MAG: ribonuclease HII [bacterium]
MILFNKRKIIAGIDEVGRGPLAGPVVSAIVADVGLSRSRKKKILAMVKNRDSKLISHKERQKIFEIIENEQGIEWHISSVWPKVIDRINIWQATLLTWKRCLKKLNSQPDFLFLDGKAGIPDLKIEQRSVIRGDQKIFLLSLASIVAKVNRDRLMKRIDKKYPEYGFAYHKGYGTELHFQRLKKFGPCDIHRKSFQPVFENLCFKEKVYYLVSQIPLGKTMTHKEIAQRIGNPNSFRAIGNILNKNIIDKRSSYRI